MENVVTLIETISGFIWGGTWGDTRILPVGPLAIVLLGTGIFMMIRLGGRPLRRFVPALKEVWDGRKAQGDDGAITPWQALSTALSGQVGTGNLAGVATAITLGGPGAIFWMWIVALFGMALAFSESSLALKYRETDEYGRINGGPMYYIKNGLGKHWGWLAVIFCLGTLFSATATGSMIQANSITEAALEVGSASFGISIPNWVVGVILSGLVFAVIIGGIKSIGSVAGKVVPVMAALYVAIAFLVLIINAPKVPGAFMEIIYSAFGWKEVFGGAAGYGVLAAVRAGIARGLFSNEAGQGSAPIAHAAAQTKNPVMQGEIAMIGVFIDTIVICTMTALVILTVTGDFEKSPSLMAANYCDDRGVVLPMNPDEEGARFSVGDLVPSAYEDGRTETIAAMGQTAQGYLASCRAAGVTFDGLFDWSDAARSDLRTAKKAHAGSDAAGAFNVLSVESAAAEEEAFYQSALAGAADPAVTVKVDHAWETDANSAAITTRAYGAALPGGEWIVPIALFFFAFTTIIGWSYYGEQALTYLVGEWATHPFRYAWVLVVFAGTMVTNTDALWLLGDIANASMAFPNLIAILALSGVVIAMHKSNGEDEDAHVVVDKSQTDQSAE